MSRGTGLLLAFDYGLKRIGVATANRVTRSASPLTTLANAASLPWPEIDALLAEWRPDCIVVGQPGQDADRALLTSLAEFVESLESRYDIPIERVDERFTSAAAADAIRTGRQQGYYNRKSTKDKLDQHAACLIAERWMNRTLD